jgi:wyosine [tRNA(Phe)-imidazoG37] synthetase (radical SAM superfamily)
MPTDWASPPIFPTRSLRSTIFSSTWWSLRVKALRTLGRLTTSEHDCRLEGARYVYAVLSRRTHGISVGIDLNPNAACNWRCVYCQVPGLSLGAGPPIDLGQLEDELSAVLDEARNAQVLEALAPVELRRLTSVAFSGNGEPTTSPDFAEAVEVLGRVLEGAGLLGKLSPILITNGSMAHKKRVLEGIDTLARLGGQVWFKLDSATVEGLMRINHSHESPEHHLEGLRRIARRCPTWVQTCVFRRGGLDPEEREIEAYLGALRGLLAEGLRLEGVHLYTLARPSQQAEATELEALPETWLARFAERITELGLEARVAPTR